MPDRITKTPENRITAESSSPPKSDNRRHKSKAHSDSLALVRAVMMVTNGWSGLNIIAVLSFGTETAIQRSPLGLR
jgi:hypothetical protein